MVVAFAPDLHTSAPRTQFQPSWCSTGMRVNTVWVAGIEIAKGGQGGGGGGRLGLEEKGGEVSKGVGGSEGVDLLGSRRPLP